MKIAAPVLCWLALASSALAQLPHVHIGRHRQPAPAAAKPAPVQPTSRACVFDAAIGRVEDCLRATEDGNLYVLRPYISRLPFERNDLAVVKIDGLGWTYVNRKGRVVVRGVAEFDKEADVFHGGLVRFVENGKYGYANHKGKVAVPPAFDGAGAFEKRYAVVCTGCVSKCTDAKCGFRYYDGGDWTLIDCKGRTVKHVEQRTFRQH